MDILQYSVVKEQSDLCSCVAALPTIIGSVAGCIASFDSARWYQNGVYANMFVCPALWYAAVPCAPPGVNVTPGSSNSLCVVDASGAYRQCGVCCLWTVPSGVSWARFQIWGAGSGTNSGCCCGGAPFGSTGAYASTIVPVDAGWTYTLCAGCARCCFDARASSDLSGCQSWVSGCGLDNFCALGGCNSLWIWMRCSVCNCYGYRISSYTSPVGGACMCNGCFDYCFSNSCATCGKIPFLYSNVTIYYGNAAAGTRAASVGSIVAGIRGIYRAICWDTSHNNVQCHPPIFGFDTLTQCCFCTNGASCTCAGGCNCTGANILRFPGAGGWGQIVNQGGNSSCGDMGRGGMVCVTWW